MTLTARQLRDQLEVLPDWALDFPVTLEGCDCTDNLYDIRIISERADHYRYDIPGPSVVLTREDSVDQWGAEEGTWVPQPKVPA